MITASLFTADEFGTGQELWASNGSPGGTTLFKDISLGSSDSNPGYLNTGTNHLFFQAEFNLWRSDGTALGTIPLPDITGHLPEHPRNFRSLNGVKIFTSRGPTGRHVIYRSDGTQAGTFIIHDLFTNQVVEGYSIWNQPAGNDLYFTTREREINVADPETYSALWRTDGTILGTERVMDFPNTINNSAEIGAELNGQLLISAQGNSGNAQLWISRIDLSGAELLKDLDPITPEVVIRSMVSAGELSYLNVRPTELDSSAPLWVTDGTTDGTQVIHTFSPGTADRVRIESLAAFGDLAVIVLSYEVLTFGESGRNQDFFRELWLSDGTELGTHPVFISGVPDARLQVLGIFYDQLYFVGASETDELGEELYSLSIPEPTTLVLVTFLGVWLMPRNSYVLVSDRPI